MLTATPVDDFDQIQAEFGEWRLKQFPEFSTRKGFYKYNDRLDSYSEDMFDILKVYTLYLSQIFVNLLELMILF